MRDLRSAGRNPEGYDELPECVKLGYTPLQYAWLSDAEKARLVQTETEPEWSEP